MFKSEMMQRIVPNVIAEIAYYEAWEECRNQLSAKNDGKEPMESNGYWNAKRNGHHQAIAIARKVVMHAMGYEMNALAQLARRTPMKYEAMQGVFCK